MHWCWSYHQQEVHYERMSTYLTKQEEKVKYYMKKIETKKEHVMKPVG
jgi:hypothetical protein